MSICWAKRCIWGVVVAFALQANAESGSQLKKARELFAKAEADYKAGRYRIALRNYEAAYLAHPLAGFNFNIGQCYRALGEHQTAINYFHKYLEESKALRFADRAQRLIKLSRMALEREREAEDVPPRRKDRQLSVATDSSPERQVSKAASKKPLARFRPVYFWTTAALAGAMLLTTAVTGPLALKKSSEYKDVDTPDEKLLSLRSDGRQLKLAATVTFSIGMTAAAAAAVLFFFTDFSKGSRTNIAASPTAHGAVASIGGQF